MSRTGYLAVYDTLADWETGYLLVELRTGRFTGTPWNIVTLAESRDPITTMGGVRVQPDLALSELSFEAGDLLILPGAELYDAGGGQSWTATAARFLQADASVAAICGATAGLARAGLLDDRRHTSAAAEYLAAQENYRGQEFYVQARAVADGGVITAGPQSPVQFARAVLGHLGLADESVLQAYEEVFHDGNPAAFAVLEQAGSSA